MKHLLQQFNNLTLHPKNATALKGLILELAVQGKLTENWRAEHPDVENSEKLLHKVLNYNKTLLKKKKRRVKEPKEIKLLHTKLPDTWVKVKKGKIFTLQKGKNPKDLSETKKKYPYLDIEALDRDNVRRYSNDDKAPKCTKDEILVVCDGSRSGLILDGKDGVIGSTLAVIEAPDYIQEYIKILFLEDFEKANSSMKGAAIPHLDINRLLGTEVGFPPLQEQKAIVAIVEELFAEVEQLEQKTQERIQLKKDYVTSALHKLSQTTDVAKTWQDLQTHFATFFNEKANIKSLRESILQLAVQGKLTKNWREERRLSGAEVESATELLKRITEEKKRLIEAKKIRKEKPLPKITEDEKPFELPEGWVWCRLTDLTNVGTGSTPSKTNLNYYGGDIPWYTSSATNDDFAKVQDVKITQEALKETNCKIFPEGTLIIAMYGQGKTRGQISELVVPGATNQAIAGMVFFESSKETKYYLKYFFQKFYREIRLLAEGGAQPNLNVGKVKATLIPLPPLEEQKAIVKIVDELMAYCDSLEREIEQRDNLLEDLMASCLVGVENDASGNDFEELGMVAEEREKYNNKG